jgi:hypothetical protein
MLMILVRDFCMPTYRRLKGSDVWHWCTNCSQGPRSIYIEVTSAGRPAGGALDKECLAKQAAGECGE